MRVFGQIGTLPQPYCGAELAADEWTDLPTPGEMGLTMERLVTRAGGPCIDSVTWDSSAAYQHQETYAGDSLYENPGLRSEKTR